MTYNSGLTGLTERIARVRRRGIEVDDRSISDPEFPRAEWTHFEGRCDFCRDYFHMWFTTDALWQQLPHWARHTSLCQNCYRKLLTPCTTEDLEQIFTMVFSGVIHRLERYIRKIRRDLPDDHPDKLGTPPLQILTGRIKSSEPNESNFSRPLGASDQTVDYTWLESLAPEQPSGLQLDEPQEPTQPSSPHQD
jgi:hypothetical protein